MTADEVDLAARSLVARAKLDAATVTELIERAALAAGAHLVGLDDRVKTVGSLTRKLEDLLAQDATLSIDDVEIQVYDVLRFTLIADLDVYLEVHDHVLASLDDQGIDVVIDSNRWAGPGYRGINVHLRAAPARQFEVQFHTRDSFEAAKATRGLYEEFRHRDTDPRRRAELLDLIDRAFARVPIPDGAVR